MVRPFFLVLSTAILALAPPSTSNASTPNLDFGRYSERLVRCNVTTSRVRKYWRYCGQLRIQQHIDGLMSIRFSLGGNDRSSNEDLVFAGVVSNGSKSMACKGDGRCEPRFPLTLQVSAISTAIFDRNGLAITLPMGLVARGSCRIETLRARCEATDMDGASWSADGFFPVLAPPAT
jgi:hypothetical protein